MKYLFVLLLCLQFKGFSQSVNVSAVMDTSKIRIGEQAHIDFYIELPASSPNYTIQWPEIGDTLTNKVEVVTVSPIDTMLPGKSNPGKLIQHQRLTISVYDSGFYAIPPFQFIVNGDTTRPHVTQPFFLEVHTIPTDTSDTKIKDIKPPFEEPFNWKWYISYAYGIFGVIVAILVIVLLGRVLRKKEIAPTGPPKPMVPPHVTALDTLEKIKEQSIWKQGLTKEYYSEISDAIRLYIEGRYGINALESTTDEIMLLFRSQVIDTVSLEKLKQLLTLSDLVKFAKMTPVEAEHDFTLQNAFDFVKGTLREEEPMDTANSSEEVK